MSAIEFKFNGEYVAFDGTDEWEFPATAARMRKWAKGAAKALAELKQEQVKPDFVPGELHCAKCKFRLSKRVLNMQSGTVHCGTSKTEPCPNGCGLLWPITWEQEARESYLLVDQLFSRAIAAEESCRKLTTELNAQNGPTFMGDPTAVATFVKPPE